mmetsp:Transcript_8497/g.14572  ORF Transcript_8497/g.14572 Transcript_8497/m.14572 type:complete len:260 (-) Transcript_8497:595-1374(-)
MFLSRASSYTILKAVVMYLSCSRTTSSKDSARLFMLLLYSMYDTTTPPPLVRRSGHTLIPRAARILFASTVIPALDPSITTPHCSVGAVRLLMVPLTAANTTTSQGIARKLSSFAIGSPSGNSARYLPLAMCARRALMSRPAALYTAVSELATPITLPPCSCSISAATAPFLPNPWTIKVQLSMRVFITFLKNSLVIIAEPRPLALSRPSQPCNQVGFPDTTPGLNPRILLYWSKMWAMVFSSVPMSGAGTQMLGPSNG